jgi:hypothetical protein
MEWALLGLTIAAIVIALVAAWYARRQAVAGETQLALDQTQAERQGAADLVVGSINAFEKRNAPAGWQVQIFISNAGTTTASGPEVWLQYQDGSGTGRNPFPQGDLAPGEPWRTHRDLGRVPDGTGEIWLGWTDMRGPQTKDSGYRI